MILNPLPIQWEMETDVRQDRMFKVCPYNKRYMLPCKQTIRRYPGKPPICRKCFFWQEGLTTKQTEIYDVLRVCDRCGAQITDPDSILYCIVRNRKGEELVDMELCPACSKELTDWVEGKEE